MNRVLIILVGLFILGLGGWWGEKKLTRPLSALIPEVLQTKQSQSLAHDSPPQSPTPSLLPPDQSLSTPASSTIPERIVLENPAHTFQTFNNCGPATLSMALGYYGATVSQQELGQKMRPYQNPQGDNDDKTIFSAEFVRWAKEYGLQGESRVNGDIELLQRLTANGFPVVVKTWLEPGDDVGHFRLVKGYDQSQQVIIQDDSYQGKDLEFTSEEFLALWQPFNYNYIVIYKPEQTELLKTILGDAWDEQTAWQMAYDRAHKEQQADPQNVYPWFNLSTSAYHLDRYEESVKAYEEVAGRLPARMLWYQIEPLQAYFQLGKHEKLLQITTDILSHHNRAYTELYLLRGEVFLLQGNYPAAKQEFELAVTYNLHDPQAQAALNQLLATDR